MSEQINIPKNGIEIRCPNKFRKLFLILRQEHMPQAGMLMEIACADCAKWARANGAPGTHRFLHYYDSSGICVANKVVAAPGDVFLAEEKFDR